MSLPIHLQSIKSSGVYRFVYDKSVISSDTAEILRLIVGYSDKGPFNTPVYITSRDEFIRTYGNISKRLEKKGVFFHRIALQALNAGPILCLNLKPFNDDNKLQNVVFNANSVYEDLSENNAPEETAKTVIDVYDTNRFWTLNFDDLAEFLPGGDDDKKYAIISATDSVDASCTVIVRPTKPYEYQISIREYYAGVGDEMPEYLEPIQDEMLSNYFADIYVFKGQFTPELCKVGGPFAKYFNVKEAEDSTEENPKFDITLEENYVDAFGNKADVLEALANNESSNYIAAYRGTSIPFFKNAQGSYISLDLLFNSGYSEHKMLMKMDESKLDETVALGSDDAAMAERKTLVNNYLKFFVIGEAGYDFYEKTTDVTPGETTYSYEQISEPTSEQIEAAFVVTELPTEVTAESENLIKINTAAPEAEPVWNVYEKKTITTPAVTTYSYKAIDAKNVTEYMIDIAVKEDEVPEEVTAADPDYIKIIAEGDGGIEDEIKYYELKDSEYREVTLANYEADLKAELGVEELTEAQEKKAKSNYDKALKKAMKNAVEVDELPTEDKPLYVKITAEVTDPSIHPVYIKGYEYNNLDGLDNYTNDVLSVITGDYGRGLQEALTNRIDVEYHYLIDSFGTIAGPVGANDKKILSALARKKDNCFAILNFPKIKDFIKAKKYNTNNTLDFKKVVKDFVLPDEADGASWCGFFTQVVVNENSVQYTIPSAGLVSNLFIDKWSARQPYYIIAGSQYGRLYDNALIGPDYAFAKDDRDVLEPYGINVIIYEPRRGTYINSDQTAKQQPVSALSKIHIRELVIYLQDEIADLLESYRWELNTQVLRDKIKNKADVILSTVQNNGGLYDFLNVCDESNNTSETIDNELLILDTHIEPARGAGKMVEQLYIYRTGEMRSLLLQG